VERGRAISRSRSAARGDATARSSSSRSFAAGSWSAATASSCATGTSTDSRGFACSHAGRGVRIFGMVGIVVVGHGRLAEEMVQTLEGVLGPLEGVVSVPTTYSDTPEAIRTRVAGAVREVDRGRGVIIVTDMLGDTPTNQSLAVARETGAEVVAGVNMP